MDAITPDETSDKKKLTLIEFKKRIQDCKLIDQRDEFIQKWLVARSYNINEAEKMLRASLAWRETNGVDDVLKWTPPEVIQKYVSYGKIGHDKFDCPLYISLQGRIDYRGILQSVTRKEYMKFHNYNQEKLMQDMREECLRTGKNVAYQSSLIIDVEGLSMRQIVCKSAVDVGTEAAKVNVLNYPEIVRRIFVINAPKLFTVIYNILKPFVAQETQAKMRIFGCNKEEWKAALLEEIDADQLPAFYGGTMVDPDGDPKCPSKFNFGGEVPHSYYLSNSAPVAKDYMETINIGAGGSKKLQYKIDVANSILRWEFMTEGGDIGFRVYYKSSDKDTDDLVPLSRIESHLIMEEGEFICANPGQYVVMFDNTFSLLRSKKLRYHIVVDPPVSASLTVVG
ncbi:SEC14-like protein 2 [Daphnia pulex]|uniref:SEC14-like protein 2 n=1 Tax=Daphnia pulex TaxID=6669 RepID=UPI001EE0CCCB|nr:SEC14-like protein 2 [Daphnia pulex]